MTVKIKPLALVLAVAIAIKGVKLDLAHKSATADFDYLDAKGNVVSTSRHTIEGETYDAWRIKGDDVLIADLLKAAGAESPNNPEAPKLESPEEIEPESPVKDKPKKDKKSK